MTTLITGGTSQIGLELAKRLIDAGKSIVIAGRSPTKIPSGYESVLLDWYNPSTFGNAFTQSSSPIENVYILAPPGVFEPLEIVKPFIDLAIENGVRFFVLISASSTNKGDGAGGRIHQYLDDKGVAYFVLQPTWFIENIFNGWAYGIRERGEIVTSSPKGRIPFVSVEDIAQVAFEAIVNHPKEKERTIIGPELLSYDELASALKDFVGKPVVNKVVPAEEKSALYKSYGLSEEYAKWLVELEVRADEGSEERRVGHSGEYVGKLRLLDVLEKRRDFWTS